MLSLLSEILNTCTGENDAAVANLALEGLYALCEEEVGVVMCTEGGEIGGGSDAAVANLVLEGLYTLCEEAVGVVISVNWGK